jgi:hypothetical protein
MTARTGCLLARSGGAGWGLPAFLLPGAAGPRVKGGPLSYFHCTTSSSTPGLRSAE